MSSARRRLGRWCSTVFQIGAEDARCVELARRRCRSGCLRDTAVESASRRWSWFLTGRCCGGVVFWVVVEELCSGRGEPRRSRSGDPRRMGGGGPRWG
ncbi:calcium-transporting ATPase, endoplasmic reticulum-type [Iris pallida]|uniref:Calcium-transporting ATPase, endoplasmic reticulum-type n=1 Tax=Iris pallida TaxID=29817 RepID=A0AAX6GA92_IRIPA|nr:calcium-transporting ATPase, endoplasmic reticulum-type [Iris pallida]